MSDRKRLSDVRVFHPRALRELGLLGCTVALGVARDLRTGAIPPENYDQRYLKPESSPCGTACCIAGHMAERGVSYCSLGRVNSDIFCDPRYLLVSVPTPAQAADAIERYVYDGAKQCWG